MRDFLSDFFLISKFSSKRPMEKFLSLIRVKVNKLCEVFLKDMNSRELLQERRMLPNGDTVWEDSVLVDCAKKGRLCILDGIERIHWSALEVCKFISIRDCLIYYVSVICDLSIICLFTYVNLSRCIIY